MRKGPIDRFSAMVRRRRDPDQRPNPYDGAPEPDLAGALNGAEIPVPLRGIPVEADGERVPDDLFDGAFYRRLYADVDDRPRMHFAERGRGEGRAPSAGAIFLAEAIRLAARDSARPMHDLIDLLPPDSRHRARGRGLWNRLWTCVHPDVYVAQLGAAERSEIERLQADGLSAVDAAFTHFLASGARAGKRVTALFNHDWYAARLDERGLAVPDGTSPFFHWLTVGWDERIVPTPLFDEGFYRDRHPSVASSSGWGFVHFMDRGCYAPSWQPSPTGRHHDGAADPDAAGAHRPLLTTQLLHHATDYDLTRTSWLEEGQRITLARHERFSNSPKVAELVRKAAAIEPLIHMPRKSHMSVSLAPYRQNRVHLHSRGEDLRRALGSRSYDAVLLVPGDNESAGTLAEAFERELRSRTRATSVLVVATDTPPTDSSFDVHRFTGGMTTDLQVDLLQDLVRGVEATTIVTIGSALGWALYSAYVRQLSTKASLGGVLLPDRDEDAELVRARLMEDCFGRLDFLAVDNESERARLVERFALPQVQQQRLLTVDPADPVAGVARALEIPRRSA